MPAPVLGPGNPTEYHSLLVEFWWGQPACSQTVSNSSQWDLLVLKGTGTNQRRLSLWFVTRYTLLGVLNQVKAVYSSIKTSCLLTSFISFDQSGIYNCFILFGTGEESSYTVFCLGHFLVVVLGKHGKVDSPHPRTSPYDSSWCGSSDTVLVTP